VAGFGEAVVRDAGIQDLEAAGHLLHDFNTEFGEPTPSPPVLADRLRQLLEGGDTVVLIVGDGPDGLVVLRFRAAIWSRGMECYVAELYVVPPRRRQGLGRALMEAAIQVARQRGADTMDIGVDEPDTAARRLYESLGFTNRVGGEDGPVMYVLTRSRTKQTVPPAGSTAARTRAGKPAATVGSGVKVKMSGRSCSAARANTASHNCSRRRTKACDPNGNIVVSRSTTRWLWNTG
jgi:ribosomal protein S18 acetylase RimI-like enzyme